jgi:hypothetical protein
LRGVTSSLLIENLRADDARQLLASVPLPDLAL